MRRFLIGSKSAPNRLRIGSESALNRLQTGKSAPNRLENRLVGSKSAPNRLQIGSKSDQNRLRIGSKSAPNRLRIGSESAPRGPAKFKLHGSRDVFCAEEFKVNDVQPETTQHFAGPKTAWSLCLPFVVTSCLVGFW